jgi:hypothetical protein
VFKAKGLNTCSVILEFKNNNEKEYQACHNKGQRYTNVESSLGDEFTDDVK